MKKLINLKDSYKIIIIYLITTIVSIIVACLVVKYDYIQIYLKNYLWVLTIFTIIFLLLIRLFKVKFKSVLIFLGTIMCLLIFVLINLDFFTSSWSTPNEIILPIISIIALFITWPFQSVIDILVAYDIAELSCIIVPMYILILSVLSYIALKFKVKN